MRGTDHPSIVKLYAFSESAEYYYLILERQCSLSQVIIQPSESDGN